MRLFVTGAIQCFSGRSGRQAGKPCLFLAVLMAGSVLMGTAQINAQRQAAVSTNELRAPHEAQAEAHHAREALEHRRYTDARKHIARALEIYPDYALALQLRGVLDLRERHLEQACADFQQAIDSDPNFGAAYMSLGAAYNRLGHFREAVIPLSRADAILPTTWVVQYEMALAYLGTGKYEDALNAISRAARNNPADPDNRSSVFYTKARVLLELKDYPAARAAFEQSIQQDPAGRFAQLSQEILERLSARASAK
ncbi:MAG TPA: tetratricopeptide repeat protein [Verrucomicrobiae bacterium]|nr:tetratricopeptide repeat protein [Verrucomicrobiae bacterium]